MTEPLTSRRVCEIAGISYRNLDYWTRTGVLWPDDPLPGSGHQRAWTQEALAATILAARLRQEGHGLPTIRRLLEDWRDAGSPRDGYWLVDAAGRNWPAPDPAGICRTLAHLPGPILLLDLATLLHHITSTIEQEEAA